jgi:AraC family transcriptional regulator of adaptative response/methylated-DNA-[protein]-cysteine methyltransferase
MPRTPATPLTASSRDETRWEAFVARDASFEGQFYIAVNTTGIYCRPGCPARLPKRANVRFFDTRDEAERAGFRPCKRCKPDKPSLGELHAGKVAQACRLIETADEAPNLDDLAAAVGLSPYHFHRIFKQALGLTPKAYAAAHRAKRVREGLGRTATVTEAIYDAGFNSNGRFYASASEVLGMTPTDFRSGGVGQAIRHAIGTSSLGSVLVAASEKGICAILLGDDPESLERELQAMFPRARLTGGDKGFAELTAKVACATNRIAVAIPCHRVIGSNGSLTGYRGGLERKRALLAKEAGSKFKLRP